MKYNNYFELYVSSDGLVFREENGKLTGHEKLYAASRYYFNKYKTLNGFVYNERKKAPV